MKSGCRISLVCSLGFLHHQQQQQAYASIFSSINLSLARLFYDACSEAQNKIHWTAVFCVCVMVLGAKGDYGGGGSRKNVGWKVGTFVANCRTHRHFAASKIRENSSLARIPESGDVSFYPTPSNTAPPPQGSFNEKKSHDDDEKSAFSYEKLLF